MTLTIIRDLLRRYRMRRHRDRLTRRLFRQRLRDGLFRLAFGDLAGAIVDGLDRHNRKTASELVQARERIEFVRLEVMYEIQSQIRALKRGAAASGAAPDAGLQEVAQPGDSASTGGAPGPQPSMPPARQADKIHALRARAKDKNDLSLNIGCGHLPLDGHVNIDMRDLPGVDLCAPADDIPLEPQSVRHIYSAHLLEHFTDRQLIEDVLPHWFSLLGPSGTLKVIVPDSQSMMQAWHRGEMSFEDLRLVTYGQQEYQGDFHYTMFTPASLSDLLAGAGFADSACIARGRRNDVCHEMEITARRPDR